MTAQIEVHKASLSIGFPIKNTGAGCHFLLQGIFLTQGLNPCLLWLIHWQVDSLPLCHQGSPYDILLKQPKLTDVKEEAWQRAVQSYYSVLTICVPLISTHWNWTLDVMVFRTLALERWLDHNSGAHMHDFRDCKKEDPESSIIPSVVWGYLKKMTVY